jgi:hypothetical protein
VIADHDDQALGIVPEQPAHEIVGRDRQVMDGVHVIGHLL